MKFDYIIGNPPYQFPKSAITDGANSKKLWSDITKSLLSKKISDDISFITPASARQLFKNAPEQILYFDYTANDYFDVGVLIASWHWKKNNTKIGPTTDPDGVTHISEKFIPKDKQVYYDLEQKMKKYSKGKSKLFCSCPTKFWDSQKAGDVKIFTNYNKNTFKWTNPFTGMNNKKLGLSSSMAYKADNLIVTTEVLGPLQRYVDITNLSKDEIKSIIKFLYSDVLVNFVAMERYAKGTGFTTNHWHLPTIDTSKKSWTDTEVGNVIGLSPTEVQSILQFKI